jgi:hypothetical protein
MGAEHDGLVQGWPVCLTPWGEQLWGLIIVVATIKSELFCANYIHSIYSRITKMSWVSQSVKGLRMFSAATSGCVPPLI